MFAAVCILFNTNCNITSSNSNTCCHWANYTVSRTQVFQHFKGELSVLLYG